MEQFEENRNVMGSTPHRSDDETRGFDIAGAAAVVVMVWGPFLAAALSSL